MAETGNFFTDPALKRVRMRLFTVVVVVFTLVCSGSFGMEDVVSGSGPGFTILMIVLLPFFWSVPMAFISSELGSAIPEEGGFGRWCRRGLGEYWGFQTSWWWTLSLYVDSAVYITLALGYIQSKWGMSDNWRWLLGIGLVAFFTFINIRGLDLTGKALIVIQADRHDPLRAASSSGASPRAPETRSRRSSRRAWASSRRAAGSRHHDVDVLRVRVHVDGGRRGRESRSVSSRGPS